MNLKRATAWVVFVLAVLGCVKACQRIGNPWSPANFKPAALSPLHIPNCKDTGGCS